jgi:sugar phosphate isomerase/epimerase
MPLIPSISTGFYVAMTPAQMLRKVAEIGWPAVEICSEHAEAMRTDPSALEEFKRAAAQLPVAVEQLHAWINSDIAAVDDSRRNDSLQAVSDDLRLCAELGIPVAVIHAGGYGAAPDDCALTASQQRAAIERLRVESFTRLAGLCTELGVRLALENTVDAWPGGASGRRRFGAMFEELFGLCDRIDPDVLGICLDTSHANWEQIDIPDAIRQCGDRLWALHMSDNFATGDDHLTPGDGNIEWPPIVDALRDIGYDRPFNLEITSGRGRDESLRDLRCVHALNVARQLVGEPV